MPYLLQSSPTVSVWLTILIALITPSLALIGVWLNRKRYSSVKAEDNKTDAEAQRLQVEILANLYGQLRNTHKELAETIDENAQKARELREIHAKQIEFLQSQVHMKDEKEYQAHEAEKVVRGRFHAAQHEIERCIFRIRDYEEQLRALNVAIIPFDFSSYKDLLEGKYKQGKDASFV